MNNGIKLECHHCDYIWEYTGKHKIKVRCPDCDGKVKIKLASFEMPEELEVNDIGESIKLAHKEAQLKRQIKQIYKENPEKVKEIIEQEEMLKNKREQAETEQENEALPENYEEIEEETIEQDEFQNKNKTEGDDVDENGR